MGYLVISRKVGERVFIGDTEVLVRSYDSGRITLAIDAPRNVLVQREEELNFELKNKCRNRHERGSKTTPKD